ncbi:hypothetical protein ABEF95_015551 [Exophiala dermatitidis]
MRLKSHVSENVFLHIPPSLLAQKRKQEDRNDDGGHDGDGAARSTRPDNLESQRQARQLTLVFFITGNPGLIGYYGPFLRGLGENLNLDERKDERSHSRRRDHEDNVVVAGFSLGGFEVEAQQTERLGIEGNGNERDEDKDAWLRELLYPAPFSPSAERGRLYSLQDQIELSYARVEKLASTIASLGARNEEDASSYTSRLEDKDNSSSGNANVNVILMGHSVGAYIALEIVRLWNQRHRHSPTTIHTDTDTDDLNDNTSNSSKVPTWTPISCILLTPTIINIHESPSGRLATPLLTTTFPIPSLSIPNLAQTLAHLQTSVLPRTWLSWLIQKATNQKQNSHGLETTLAFLTKCPMGVKQALYMAGDEMREIRGDKWGEEVWGAATAVSTSESTSTSKLGLRKNPSPSPKLYFWFAKSDHWVADLTKQEIQKIKLGGGLVEKDCFNTNIPCINDHDRDNGDGNGNATATKEEVQVQFKHKPAGPNQAPMIKICETDGLVHAWCLEQSEFVARRVSGWIREILVRTINCV